MKVLFLVPCWADVESMDNAVELAQEMEQAARLNVEAVLEKHGATMDDMREAGVGYGPVQILQLPEGTEFSL